MTDSISVSEKRYVNDVYDNIAEDFSRTRTIVWEYVKLFIDSIKEHSYCIDIGCGNGKNMYREDINMIGIDTCKKFVDICNQRNKHAYNMDCCELSFNDNVFDAAISIAVFHHLSSHERRQRGLSEMIRVLKPNGFGLISLWSYENQSQKQNKRTFIKGDNMVSWKHSENGVVFKRYYHIFDEKAVDNYLLDFENDINIINKCNLLGNWYVIFQKCNKV
jgi:alkylated DNA repair protein alkB family protein 8